MHWFASWICPAESYGDNIPHGAAFRVARLDLFQLLLRDAADLQELFRVVLQHVERICTEPLDDASGRTFSNALEKTR